MIATCWRRNRVTEQAGFPKLRPGEFWDLGDATGGVFLADVLVACARGEGKLYADGVEVQVPAGIHWPD